MPKRPKAKVKTTTTERKPSEAKQRRIKKQAENESINKLEREVGHLTTWEKIKMQRQADRILMGKHEKWLTKQATAKTKPSASNLLVG